ncbi:MAG: hypothetical protein MZV63_54315 [Marinilabiliales bacterium]|nr:hypothetical protein [Marinilabiliales bacterium]
MPASLRWQEQRDKITDITVAIDKLDKIGQEGVRQELIAARHCPEMLIARLEPVISLSGSDGVKA